jgi:exopolysaccharide biosynthesis polyprenyl glycosylphosphotransferase
MVGPKRESCLNALGLDDDTSAFGFQKSSVADILLGMPEAGRNGQRDRILPERLVVASLVCDGVVILYAMLAAFWLRFCTPLAHYGVEAKVTLGDYSGYIALGMLSLMGTLSYMHLYDRHKLLHLRKVTACIIKATLFWYIGFLSISLMFKFQPPISRGFVSMAAATALGGLLFWRWSFHRFLQSSSIASRLSHRILFVGWNEESARLTESFESDYVRSYNVVGCVASLRSRFQSRPKVNVLGQYEEIGEIIRRQAIDMVILSDVNSVKGEIIGLANLCEREMVQFKVIPSYFQILVSGLHLETVSGIPVLGVSQLPLDRIINILFKRAVDIVGAVVGLLLSLPLIAVSGLMIYLESPGSIFFAQERIGRNGMRFKMYKLRSMKLGADKADHLSQSTRRNDDRLLRIGAFLRRWNIDETPQFWNVIKGDMSLVGPRPERPYHSDKLSEKIPHYNARYNTKPGITGWAQVKGLRGDTDLSERIRADLFYLENWNLLLDFQIMAMTFLHRDNAY